MPTGPGHPIVVPPNPSTSELVAVLREVCTTLHALEASVEFVVNHYRGVTTRLASVEIQQATCPDSCPFKVPLSSEEVTPVATLPSLKDEG